MITEFDLPQCTPSHLRNNQSQNFSFLVSNLQTSATIKQSRNFNFWVSNLHLQQSKAGSLRPLILARKRVTSNKTQKKRSCRKLARISSFLVVCFPPLQLHFLQPVVMVCEML